MSVRTKPSTITLSLLLLVGIIAISFSSIFIRWSAAPISVIAMYRLYLTNLIMLPFLIKFWPEIKAIPLRNWLLLLVTGAALGVHFLFWMSSLRYTSVASSTAILSLEPVLVLLGSILAFRQRNHPLVVVGMIVAVIGTALIGWGDFGLSARYLQGDVLSLLGTAAVAVHMLLGQKLRATMSAYVYSFFSFFMAANVLALYNLILGYSFGGYSAREWGIFALLAIIPTLIGHYLFNWLLKYMKASSVSMSILGEPVGSTILAYFMLKESVPIITGVAALLLLLGVWLFMKGGEREKINLREPEAAQEQIA
ncbi:DMT family transporter [Gorillibacterium massiliense]|uniref:DMT family transporter n=1 Tax=Gorillibacterium massiliense TaxID=1280390 RepID=UPI0004AD7201|nr:DMT family transporter [Gorillibacterium massiliense]